MHYTKQGILDDVKHKQCPRKKSGKQIVLCVKNEDLEHQDVKMY